ncbi:hypothetical protein BKA70DRAFT_1096365, partial [Coprinopsis sp. MPI-PUGE-AT-0042]
RFIEFCIQYASLTLVYYDYILTFGREMKYVWGRKFHILTVMFLFCRYSTVANIIFAVGLVNKFYGLRVNLTYRILLDMGLTSFFSSTIKVPICVSTLLRAIP